MPLPPQDELLLLLRKTPPQEVQNRLLQIGDRELALAMMYMGPGDREYFTSFFGPRKKARVEEEFSLQKNIRITYDQYKKGIELCLEKMKPGSFGSGPGTKSNMGSYLRPVRKSKRSR